MDLFSSVNPGIAFTILSFLFVLSIVVTIHELGHFLVGRWCDVDIDVFSLGFGPELLGWNDRHGTRWKISAIPLGGYVKFSGDANAASLPDSSAQENMNSEKFKHTLAGRPLWQRAAIVAAGPFANFLLAIMIFASTLLVFGKVVVSPTADALVKGGAAELAGMQSGDTVLFIDDTPIQSFSDMQQIVSTNAGNTLIFVVDRNGTNVELTITPQLGETTDFLGNTREIGLIGVQNLGSETNTYRESFSIPSALKEGTLLTWSIIEQTMGYVYGIIVGREKADQLSGPLGIADASGKVASLGFGALLNWIALISVSIGLINLFPIPMLDGGHLLFYAIEAVRGKPLSGKTQEYGAGVGLALVLLLLFYATWNDISRFLGN